MTNPHEPTTQPPQPYAYPHPYYPPPQRGTNRLAVASLVLGIVWMFWLGSILAVIFGHVALAQIKRNGDSGKGLAVAGFVLGYIGLFVLLISFAPIIFAAA